MKTDDRFIKGLKEIIKNLVFYLVIVIILTQFVFRPFRVDGDSMYPSIKNGELGFSDAVSLKIQGVKRFDIVIVYSEATNKFILKRVIGLPNDIVQYDNDTLYVNGKKVEETFLNQDHVNKMTDNGSLDFTDDFGPITLANDEYFLMGDNRMRSTDSRHTGPYKIDDFMSKNGVVFFPFNRMRVLGGK
jgi:signal peptidase I